MKKIIRSVCIGLVFIFSLSLLSCGSYESLVIGGYTVYNEDHELVKAIVSEYSIRDKRFDSYIEEGKIPTEATLRLPDGSVYEGILDSDKVKYDETTGIAYVAYKQKGEKNGYYFNIDMEGRLLLFFFCVIFFLDNVFFFVDFFWLAMIYPFYMNTDNTPIISLL